MAASPLMKRPASGIFVAVLRFLPLACLVVGLKAGAASAQVGNPGVQPGAQVTYSQWWGQCSTSRIADVRCVMRQDARSVADELLGYIVFGEEDRGRFLAVDVVQAMAGRPLVVKIDGAPIPNGTIACRGRRGFCSIVIRVDDEWLARLMNGSELTIESEGAIEMRFPLREFAGSRRALL
jgi:invasion protein IalB